MSARLLLAPMLALAAFAVAVVAGWLIAALAGVVIRTWTGLTSSSRAALLAQARLAPLAGALVLVPAQIAAFARLEAGGDESAGPLLMVAALVGLAFCLEAVRSAVAAYRQTHAVLSDWRSSATPLALPLWTRRAWAIRRRFPIVAVVGIVRPELFMATQVARECSGPELAAISAHEAAHVGAGDNLLRLLYRVTPGSVLRKWIGDRLEREWALAAEHTADATAREVAGAIDLASALTKVAGLAAGSTDGPIAASTLIGASELDSRVRRLLAPASMGRHSRAVWMPAAAVLAALVIMQTSSVQVTLHELFELFVQRY